ncbi:hypothetical protein [Chromobacterium haemolyticum]|uniref:hypothetical protein n=1 Tax=Chromobacterium haemolyticum TaxID=394935 RepID=UPI0024482628|nr:hypothetical protein [Chromobacterium haemolyticum]MDH0342078.1 hypothetical protein [Chromobacterium haemolyticum]
MQVITVGGTQKSDSFGAALSVLLVLVVLLSIVAGLLMMRVIHNNFQTEKRIDTCNNMVNEIQQRPVSTPIDKAAADAAFKTATTLCSQVLE